MRYILIFVASMIIIGAVRMLTGYTDGNLPVNIVMALVVTALVVAVTKVCEFLRNRYKS